MPIEPSSPEYPFDPVIDVAAFERVADQLGLSRQQRRVTYGRVGLPDLGEWLDALGEVVVDEEIARIKEQQRLAAEGKLKRRGWHRLSLVLYGKSVTLLVWSRVCLWYRVAGNRPVRVVVTKDPRGRARPRAFFCTDPERPVAQILQTFAQRWDLEVAIRNAKQSLGIEHPQNGWWRRKHGRRSDTRRPGPHPRGRRGEGAVKHTVPLAFVAYALALLWYLERGNRKRDVAQAKRFAPWYRHKRDPSFADMLAALRQALWQKRLSQNPAAMRDDPKVEEILPLWALAA